ncbi:MAG: glycosyltransferase family 2 protein [Methanobacteriota archaeon]
MEAVTRTEPKETLGLIVPTRNRLEYLRPRLPVWAGAGFDEVLVVNTPGDPAVAADIRIVCESLGIRYVETLRSLRDLRSKARNLGARSARTTWIVFSDDDVDAIADVDHGAFEAAARGRDWLAGPVGDIVVLHRREAFLAFGGYPEDMVASEDTIMSIRARRSGKGGPEGSVWMRTVRFNEPPRSEPLNRARAHFWYSLTLPLFFLRTPDLEPALASDLRRILGLARRALSGRFTSVVYLAMYLVGRMLSPLHLVSVAVRSGPGALGREARAPWHDARGPTPGPDSTDV